MNKISFKTVEQKSRPMELKVFKRSNTNDSVISNSSNPFGMTFKGKVLTSDIFESSNEKEKAPIGSKIKNANIAFCAAVADKFNKTKGIFSEATKVLSDATSRIIATTKHIENGLNKILKQDVAISISNYLKNKNNPYMREDVSSLSEKLKTHDISLKRPAIIA